MDQEYFTIPEVAQKLKVTRAAVYKWIAQGRLVAIYVGSDRRVTSSAIEAFIKASTESRQSEDSDKMETQITAPGQAAFDLATA
jgi:excisionase family DNA binding protein